MRVLVTGGTGFVGSALCEQLKSEGHEPIAFDAAAAERGGQPGHPVVHGDVTDTASLERAVRKHGIDRIVHLAAILGTDRGPGERARVNAGGPRSVLEATRRTEVERVVLASSETVYAPDSAYEAERVPEGSLLRPESAYAAAKLFAERLGREYAAEYGLPIVALRPTGIFGPAAGHGVEFAELFEKPAQGEPVTVSPADGAISWLSVRDAASAFEAAVLAADEELTRPVYNVRGEFRTVSEVAAVVRDVIPDAEITVEEGPPLDWSAQHLDLSAARADLGYEIGDGIEEIARSYAKAAESNS
jgi:UDP-glucose 4-epimerase